MGSALTPGVCTLGVYSLGLPISGLDLYLLGSLGVYTLWVYSLGLPISGLDLHMPVLKKRYRGPLNVNVA